MIISCDFPYSGCCSGTQSQAVGYLVYRRDAKINTTKLQSTLSLVSATRMTHHVLHNPKQTVVRFIMCITEQEPITSQRMWNRRLWFMSYIYAIAAPRFP